MGKYKVVSVPNPETMSDTEIMATLLRPDYDGRINSEELFHPSIWEELERRITARGNLAKEKHNPTTPENLIHEYKAALRLKSATVADVAECDARAREWAQLAADASEKVLGVERRRAELVATLRRALREPEPEIETDRRGRPCPQRR